MAKVDPFLSNVVYGNSCLKRESESEKAGALTAKRPSKTKHAGQANWRALAGLNRGASNIAWLVVCTSLNNAVSRIFIHVTQS